VARGKRQKIQPSEQPGSIFNMAAKNRGGKLSSPWKEFPGELDGMLPESIKLHCIEGFTLVHYYGFPRTTADIDYCSAAPANLNLEEVAGQGSALHKKYDVWLHRVAVANLPEEYKTGWKKWRQGNSNISNYWYQTHTIAFCRTWKEAAEKTGTMRISCSGLRNSMRKCCANDTRRNCATT
jgi:hypothetical protein